MKQIIISVFFILSFTCYSQEIQNDVVATTGDYYKTDNASISWTVGEVVVETMGTSNITLSQGFQQGNLTVTNVLDLEDYRLKTYPNPTADILIIETKEVGAKFQIIDANGKVIKNGIIESIIDQIDLSSESSGVYFLHVNGSKTHKIIKK